MRNEFRTWAKQDTLTAKRKIVRGARRAVRSVNHVVAERNGDRFWAEITRQEIRPFQDNSGWDAAFVITYHDRMKPDRDFSRMYDYHFIKYSGFFAGGDHFDTDFDKFIKNVDE